MLLEGRDLFLKLCDVCHDYLTRGARLTAAARGPACMPTSTVCMVLCGPFEPSQHEPCALHTSHSLAWQ